ncbi:MAG: tetratricopeptide repeat protein, partial [Magnetospirillum sp.]|nr:tetratricopeptide repeat protein [Magnetospirillum sp.]
MAFIKRKPIPGIPKPVSKPTWRERLRTVPIRLWGGLGLGTAVAGTIAVIVKEVVAPWGVCEFHELKRSPADDHRLTVLVSRLANDADGRQTAHVVASLEGEKGLEKLATCRSLTRTLDSQSESQARAEAETTGQAWLERFHADVLVWGEVLGDKGLRLRFLSPAGGSDGRSYGLDGQTLDLPPSFSADLATQVEALVVLASAPAVDDAGTYLVERLGPLADKLRRLHAAPPSGATPDQRASLAVSLGNVLSAIGEQGGDAARLEAAVIAYRAALELRSRERVPLAWATTQNNLGAALSSLGTRESGTARLEAAVTAYRAALEVRTRERVPLDWATTQNNLGNALSLLGERESGTARLEAAVTAYRAALE